MLLTFHPEYGHRPFSFFSYTRRKKNQYVRLSYDTRPELIVQLFTKEWNLELPKLLLTIQGGKANFELQPKLKKVRITKIVKVALIFRSKEFSSTPLKPIRPHCFVTLTEKEIMTATASWLYGCNKFPVYKFFHERDYSNITAINVVKHKKGVKFHNLNWIITSKQWQRRQHTIFVQKNTKHWLSIYT